MIQIATTAMTPFQSTPSVRRATLSGLRLLIGGDISIHALRVEGDHRAVERFTRDLISITPSGGRATTGPWSALPVT